MTRPSTSKLIGTTGSGKSTAIRELLYQAIKRGDRAIFADPDGGYLTKLYDPHFGDVILNPFDALKCRSRSGLLRTRARCVG